MFRQRSTAVAAALVAASLLLAPSPARAQYRYMLGGPGIYYTNPSTAGAAGYANPYFRGPLNFGLGFGNMYSGGFGFPMWGWGGYGRGIGIGGYGYGLGSYANQLGNYATPWNVYQPLTGITGYGSFYSPLNYAALPTASAFLYPSFGGYNPMYPNYVFTDSTVTALTTAADPVPLSSFPYVPRLNMAWHSSPLRTTTGYPAVGPVIAPAANLAPSQTTAVVPRVRQALFPAVGVTPGSDLLKQKLGGADTTTPGTQQPAHIDVVVPTAGTKIWFQGQLTKQSGKVRDFTSPPLAPDGRFVYEVRAQWTQDGQPVTQTRMVSVQAGERVRVDFTSKQD